MHEKYIEDFVFVDGNNFFTELRVSMSAMFMLFYSKKSREKSDGK